MKQASIIFIIVVIALALASCASPPNVPSSDAPLISATPTPAVNDGPVPAVTPVTSPVPASVLSNETGMKVTSSGIVNGYIDPRYGKNGTPTLSLPLKIQNAPAGTKAFAIYMDDPDAKTVAGFVFVHWMAVNITTPDIPEGYSQSAGKQFIQGKNDEGSVGYFGPAPPDKDHKYVIKVYALDSLVDLKNGFGKDAFQPAIQGHVLAEATLEGTYRK